MGVGNHQTINQEVTAKALGVKKTEGKTKLLASKYSLTRTGDICI